MSCPQDMTGDGMHHSPHKRRGAGGDNSSSRVGNRKALQVSTRSYAASGNLKSLNCSRRTFLLNFPTLVFGTESMNTMSSGRYILLNLGATSANGRSCHFGCATAITAASMTLGCDMIAFSRSWLEIHSPPLLTRSL